MEFFRGNAFLDITSEQRKEVFQAIKGVLGVDIPEDCVQLNFKIVETPVLVKQEAVVRQGPSVERATPLVITYGSSKAPASTPTSGPAPAAPAASTPAPVAAPGKVEITLAAAQPEEEHTIRPSLEPAVTVDEAILKYGFNTDDPKQIKFEMNLSETELERILEWRGRDYSFGVQIVIKGVPRKIHTYFEDGKFSVRFGNLLKTEKKSEVITATLKALGFTVLDDTVQLDIVLSDKQRSAAPFLRFSCENPGDKLDIATPEFRPDVYGKMKELPRISQFTKCAMQITTLCANFILECYCDNLEEEEKHRLNKRFMQEKTRYTLCILEPMPVAFELANGMVNVTFADTDVLSAEEIRKQVEFSMIALVKTIKLINITFKNIDCKNDPISEVKAFVRRTGHAILLSDLYDVWTTNMPVGTFQVMILPNTPAAVVREDIWRDMHKLFDQLRVYQCTGCHGFYSGGKNKACNDGDCITGYIHLGERIPFEDDGEEVHEVYNADGSVDYYEYWSCCGERLRDDVGCYIMSGDSHTTEDDGISTFSFQLN